MNTEPPHDVRAEEDIPQERRRRFVPITEAEAETLKGLSVEERTAWFAKNMPKRECLARLLDREGVPAWLVHNVRAGRYEVREDTTEYEDAETAMAAKAEAQAVVKRKLLLDLKRAGQYRVAQLIRANLFFETVNGLGVVETEVADGKGAP